LNGSNGALKISLEDLVMLNSLHQLIRNPASTPFTTSEDNTLDEEQFETLVKKKILKKLISIN